RLAAAGVRAVRLGHPARVNPALTSLTIGAQIEKDGTSDLAREWRDRAPALRQSALARDRAQGEALWAGAGPLGPGAPREIANAERAIVDRADSVLATLVGCDHPILGEAVFDCVIVDEATQAPDPLLFIPLTRGKVAVIAGDPHQLGPVIVGGPQVEATL